MKKLLKVVMPLFILMGGIAFLFFYDLFLEERINTVPVVVAAENIDFKDVFSRDNLRIKRINRDFVVKDAITAIDNLNDTHLLGELAAIDIKRGTQIYRALVDPNNLIPDESKGEFIAPIPNEWIFAVPGSIRRSYVADFYVVPKRKQRDLEKWIAEDQADKSQKPISSDDKDILEYGKLAKLKPVLRNVRVAHTKDHS
ncbi:MAG TPA: SAF domain-containing protein, partial [Bacillales bacterium]|nr:SAF domain-containing protein [Bacillales bacterium]